MELLTEKYQELLESKSMPKVPSKEMGVTALMLENQAKETERLVTEATVSTDVAPFIPIFMPLARRVQPTLIANELVGVQPLNTPTGYIYSLAFRYTGGGLNKDDRTGNRISPVAGGQILQVVYEDGKSVARGEAVKVGGVDTNVIYFEDDLILIDSKVASAGQEVKNAADELVATVQATFSNELSFRKVLKGYTGSLPTTEAEILGYDMNEIGFELKQTQVGTESRKLKAEYTVEMYQDLKSMFGKNADEELMNMMAVEVQNELDREIVQKVNSWASVAPDFKIGGTDASGSSRFELEGMAHLGVKIANESREIARLTRRGAGNVLLVSPKVATVLEQLKGFKPMEVESDVDATAVGVSVIGYFNKMKVVMDAFASQEYVTVLYKGTDRRDSIGFYCPYIPISFTRVVHSDNGQPAIILNSRYGIKENPLNADNEGIYARTFNVNFEDSFLA